MPVPSWPWRTRSGPGTWPGTPLGRAGLHQEGFAGLTALQDQLSTRVLIKKGRQGKGVIEIGFHGSEDFERLFALVAGREASEVVG